MRFKDLLTALTLAALLNGCTVRSLNPLYTEKDVVFEPGLLGTWTEGDGPDTSWTFLRDGANGYRIISGEDLKPMDGRLVKLSGHLFLDVMRKRDKKEGIWQIGQDECDMFAIPGHVFVKIELNGDTLLIAMLVPEWAEKAADLKTLGLAHMRTGGTVVLTASTKELQEFATRHAADESVFKRGPEFRRTAADMGR